MYEFKIMAIFLLLVWIGSLFVASVLMYMAEEREYSVSMHGMIFMTWMYFLMCFVFRKTPLVTSRSGCWIGELGDS